jgi:cysteine synthase A
MANVLDRPKIANSFSELIGKTPILRLSRINNTHADILVKLESENPVASVKDRLAEAIISGAEHDGLIKPGDTLIEASSGNTGIALAQLGAAKGYKVIITMPDSMSVERRALIRLFGARLVLTPAKLGMKGAIAMSEKLAKEIPGSYLTHQFETKYNALVHKETTGPEIWAQTDGKVDLVIGGAGTGGTVTGIAQFLKEIKASTKVFVVEPEESPVLSGGTPSPHKIQGIGAGFVPPVIDVSLLSEVVKVSSAEAIAAARRAAAEEGLFCGISSGAALAAAFRVGAREEWKGKQIVVIIPSFGERYLSTALYQDILEEVKNQATEDPTAPTA